MAKHNSATVAGNVRRILNTKTDTGFDSEMNVLTPVVVMQDNCTIVRQQVATNATSAVIYTTPTDQDFYLTAATIAWVKDATATALYTRIGTTIGGGNVQLIPLTGLTLTATNGSSAVSFPVPIKIDRGVTINLEVSTNTANVTARASIVGYLSDS